MIANHKGEIPFVILLLPVLLGIAVGINMPAQNDHTWWTIVFALLSLTFVFLNANYNRLKIYKTRWLGGGLAVVILFIFGLIRVISYNELDSAGHFSKAKAKFLIVKINNEPYLKNGLLRFTADVKEGSAGNVKIPLSGTLLIAIKDTTAKKLYYGDELLLPANYRAIEPPRIPAEFNYKRYLAYQNIYYQSFLYPKQYILLASNTGNPLIARSLRLRRQLVQKLKQNMADTNAIAVASTLVLGYKADLSNDVLQAYSKTGTVHVLSVSGAHVAIIYAMLAILLGFLNRFKYGRPARAFIIITVIWYYSMLTGFSPAVCRAAVMISMVIIGKTFNRYINTLNVLAVSAFVLLVYDPFFIADVGFQLSYLAVAGLIIFQPVVYKWFSFKSKRADKLWALCSVSIAAQVITFPLSAFYFHQFPVYFLISNLFIIIPSAIIMYSGILYLLLPQIPILSRSIAYVLEKTILLMNKGLAIVEHSPFAGISKLWLTVPEYLLLYVIIISIFYFMYSKKLWLIKLGLCCALLLSISWSMKKISASRSADIAWLNLGKHKGIVFKNGHNAVVMTDLTDSDKNYQYAIQPYLDSCQVTEATVIRFNDRSQNAWFIKKNNFIQFLDNKILIFNKPIVAGQLTPKLTTDFIYLTGIAGKNILAGINNNFNYHLLIVDATNRTGSIIDIEKNGRGVNYKILKSNNSLISVSNQKN